MGSLLNFILPPESQYGKWCFEGPMTQKVMNEYSYTQFPEIKKDFKNYILVEPTEMYYGLEKRIDAILRKVDIKQFIEENDLKIIICSIADAPSFERYKQLYIKLKNHKISHRCIFLTSNINLQGTNVKSYHFFIEQAIKSKDSFFGVDTTLGYKSEEITIDELNRFRNKKFLSFNRTVDKEHRFSLLHDYLTNDFSDSYFSFLTLEGIHCPPFQDDKLNIEQYLEKIPIQLDTNNKFNFSVNNTMRKDLFLDSCINLVTETSYKNNELFISEKILKPILNYQPFIVLGPVNYLQELKNLGFKTFSEFWDESYDVIKEGRDRYFKISQLVLKLNSLDIHELNELYQQTKEICIYNKNHFNKIKMDGISLFFKKL
jgi:hypothetical protein